MGKAAVLPSGNHLWDVQKVTTYGTFCLIRDLLTGWLLRIRYLVMGTGLGNPLWWDFLGGHIGSHYR